MEKIDKTINGGCIASNLISNDNYKVGYMYREQPSKNFNDSGWRFFAGIEDKNYCNDSNNFNIYDISTIVKIDNNILKYLDSPIGCEFKLNENNQFILVK